MWSEGKIIEYLRTNLKPKRFEHSLSVRDTAVKLAKHYNFDVEKASLAGLVHDCAKDKSADELLEIAAKTGFDIGEVCMDSPKLLHGYAGAVIAKELMGIEDKDVLNAVHYHTTGRKSMSWLEKAIYIADYVEPIREFPGVDEMRKMVYEDLDKTMIFAYDLTIKYVIDKGQMLHPDSIQGRNHLILESRR
ncbi:MAG: bis(5'-nucleosyl)-tetraphosphatase (symmetrical) YqeK [Solirubrobacterales bacterium]